MNMEETLRYLDEKGVKYSLTEHKAVYSMDELGSLSLPYRELDAKNLFLRDDKKENYYLLTLKGEKRADLKKLRKIISSRPLSFASTDELLYFLKLTPGSVTPLGLLNDEKHEVVFLLDSFFSSSRIGVHPNDNRATVWLESKDLVRLLTERGNECIFVDI